MDIVQASDVNETRFAIEEGKRRAFSGNKSNISDDDDNNNKMNRKRDKLIYSDDS
jgi:hypothetical protein